MENTKQEKILIKCPDCKEIVGQRIGNNIYRIRQNKSAANSNTDLEFDTMGSSVSYITCQFCDYKWPVLVIMVPGSPLPRITLRLTRQQDKEYSKK